MAAVEELITENIGIWTSAIKRKSNAGRGAGKKVELYGVKKLRELILDLAVRGLLVPQNPDDEPASELLNRIAAEKDRLVKAKQLKTKANPHLDLEEYYIPTPHSWGWIRLGNIAKFIDYRGKTPTKISSGIRLITAKNVRFGYLDTHPEEFISNEEYTSWMTRGFPKLGDILFTPEAPLGNVAIVNLNEKFALAQRTICFQFHVDGLSEFIKIAIMSQSFQRQLVGNATGMTATGIKASKLKEIPIPIPPLPEQHRIVAKVEELMALCDQLERLTETSLTAHQTLVKTLLDALTQAAAQSGENGGAAASSPSPFEQAWHRLAEHFDIVFTTEDSIEELKQTILQLAVMGKLVPQDPNDEPASELLKNIDYGRTELIKEKKIKKKKALAEITDDEKPFKVPTGWEWCRFQDLTYVITDGAHHTPTYTQSGVPFLSVKDMSNGSLSFSDTRFISATQHKELCRRCSPEKGDLLITKVGTTGVPVLIDTDISFSIFVSVALIKFPRRYLSGEFLKLLVNSPLVKKQSADGTQGVGNKNLVLKKISNFLLVCPPLEEQRRIVDKTNALITMCDNISVNLKGAEITRLQLADSASKQAFN